MNLVIRGINGNPDLKRADSFHPDLHKDRRSGGGV